MLAKARGCLLLCVASVDLVLQVVYTIFSHFFPLKVRNQSSRYKRHHVRGTSDTERDPEEGVGRGEGSLNGGDVRMLRLGDSGPGDGQRSCFPGIVEPQERWLRQVSLRPESVDGDEHQLHVEDPTMRWCGRYSDPQGVG